MIPVDQARVIIERGDRARQLLADDAFKWIVDDQTNYHLAALVAAPPGPKGADAVAYHHLQQNALSELVAALQGYAQAGEAMRNVLNDPDDDDDVGSDLD
jgi:hypothetical protein